MGPCICAGVWDCCLGIDEKGGAILYLALSLYMFKALAVVCDEYFVPALEGITERLKLSEDVAGATFMAAGSSAPELFTNIVATFFIVNAGGIGTIIGSAIFNILVIVGATAIGAKQELAIWWYPLTRDCCFYVLSITVLALVIMDGKVKLYESSFMVLMYVFYCVYMRFNENVVEKLGLSRPESGDAGDLAKVAPDEERDGPRETARDVAGSPDPPSVPEGEKAPEVVAPPSGGDEAAGGPKPDNQEAKAEAAGEKEPEEEEEKKGLTLDPIVLAMELLMPSEKHYWILFSVSILCIGVFTYFMVDSAQRVGCVMKIPPLIMGLVFLAAGTSVPDALSSLKVAQEGQGDMAVANALGSNVFDVLLCLGFPWTIRILTGVEVNFENDKQAMYTSGLWLGFAIFAFVGGLIVNRWKLSPKLGIFLLCSYVVFVVVEIVRGMGGGSDGYVMCT